MQIILNSEIEKIIKSQLNTGKYETAEQVINEALQLLVAKNKEQNEIKLQELRQKIAVAAEQIEQGKIKDGEEVFERLQEKIRSQYRG